MGDERPEKDEEFKDDKKDFAGDKKEEKEEEPLKDDEETDHEHKKDEKEEEPMKDDEFKDEEKEKDEEEVEEEVTTTKKALRMFSQVETDSVVAKPETNLMAVAINGLSVSAAVVGV